MNPIDEHFARIEARLSALEQTAPVPLASGGSVIPESSAPRAVRRSVVILWFNRPKNLEFWLHCIARADRTDTQFTVIHNCEIPSPEVRAQVEAVGVRYIARQNVGMDVGAFQDVCRHRLKDFDYNYDFLLWFTDDCLPMAPDFARRYTDPFSDPTVGMTCLEISTQIKRHVRTTGFCLPKETVEKIKFQHDPVKTKEQCYVFEHRGPDTLYEQLLKSGKKIVQVAALRDAPAWDSGGGGHGWLNRREEFEKRWEIGAKGSRVIVIATAFERFPLVVSSMLLQTYHNWELWLVHDGPAPGTFPRDFKDTRIHFVEEPGPKKNYGHPLREQYLQKIRAGHIKGDYVVVTNDDNYMAPFFIEKLVRALDENPSAPGAFCSHMSHNYAGVPGTRPAPGKAHAVDGYGIITIRAERGFIDPCAVMLRAKQAAETGWPDYSHSSDWNFLNKYAMANGGWDAFKCVPGLLVIHN